jgi:geranylgeranyl pyrophosphate synthase
MASAVAISSVVSDQTALLMRKLEVRLADVINDGGGTLAGPASKILKAGGKRLRPLLIFLCAGAECPREDDLLRAATAIELIHSATLVHDDVLDSSELRRGIPTVFATSGRKIATAAGDLLFSLALSELVKNNSPTQIKTLTTACAALVEGELMQREDAYSWDVTPDRYLQRCQLKTASLFRAACELGAINGESDHVALGDFGEKIGLAFQLLDDILDLSSATEQLGKPRGADLRDGTVTLPMIYAVDRLPELRELDLRTLQNGVDISSTCERIIATGATEEARKLALTLVEEAKAELPPLSNDRAAALSGVADLMVDRYC